MGLKFRLYKLPVIGKHLRKFIIRLEGGEKTSCSLRLFTSEKFHVNVGMYSYGGCFTPTFNTGGKIDIGRYCSFGANIHYFGADHPIDHAVMSAYFYNKTFSGYNVKDVPRNSLQIGNDVWMGYGVIIVSSCHYIGNGAVIAAGAVVTKDIPAYAVIGGVPARVIKYRFSSEVIDKLENSRWWERKPQDLMKFYNLIEKPGKWADAITSEIQIL